MMIYQSMSDQLGPKNIDDKDFALAEYSALRDEILKRIELQNQILNLALIIAGTAISVSFQLNNGPIILLIYPPIALVLSAGWEQNNLRIRQIGIYIRETIERRSPGSGWEQYRIDTSVTPTGTARFARSAFMISQIVTIGFSGLQLSSWTVQPWTAFILIRLDVIVVLGTGLIIKTIPLKEVAATGTKWRDLPGKGSRKLREWIARIFSSQ
jgi:hypothetical protein